jgi:hypothetical protein
MFECFIFFCFLGAPAAPVVPDGAGGYVPFTNSRVMPNGELRPYDPAIDGPFPGAPMAGYAVPLPPDTSVWVRPYLGPYQ